MAPPGAKAPGAPLSYVPTPDADVAGALDRAPLRPDPHQRADRRLDDHEVHHLAIDELLERSAHSGRGLSRSSRNANVASASCRALKPSHAAATGTGSVKISP